MTPAGRPVRPEEFAEAVGAPTTPFTPEKGVLSSCSGGPTMIGFAPSVVTRHEGVCLRHRLLPYAQSPR